MEAELMQSDFSQFKTRLDRALREGTRPTLGADTPVKDLLAAFKQHNLIEPKEGVPQPVYAQVGRMALPVRRWFIAQTKPQAEAVAVRALAERKIGACAPEVADWATVHRREFVRIRPLFPRYVFVGIDADNRGLIDFRTPRMCDGISGFVQGAGGMAEVRDTAIGDLMFANERRWIDFIWSKSAKDKPKKRSFATQDFAPTMYAILEAPPTKRLDMFLDRFGKRGSLLSDQQKDVDERVAQC